MSDQDITTLILREHEIFRRTIPGLRDLSADELSDGWRSVADALEVHAAAEEALFYPHVVREVPDGAEDTEHALHDHNEIRAAAAAVDEHEVGSEGWWSAVEHAQEVNGDHMAEEENDILPGVRDSLPSEQRDDLGLQWLAFHEEHEDAQGLSGEPEDPEAYVEEHAAD